jgi:hypothetical protein
MMKIVSYSYESKERRRGDREELLTNAIYMNASSALRCVFFFFSPCVISAVSPNLFTFIRSFLFSMILMHGFVPSLRNITKEEVARHTD